MSQNLTPLLPWQDRWTEPTLENLRGNLNAQHQEMFDALMKAFAQYDRVDYTLKWFGPSWNWTLQYDLLNTRKNPVETMGYLIPDIESPKLCIPLNDQQIDRLPMRRLNRVIREGIKSSKCAIEIHWCIWSPNTPNEVLHLIDLIKRKYTMVAGK